MSCLFKDAFVLRCMEEVEFVKGRVFACEERSFLVLVSIFPFTFIFLSSSAFCTIFPILKPKI